MKRAVFDANVWVSAAAFPGSVPDRAIHAARLDQVQSVTSEALIEQVSHALRSERLRVSPSVVSEAEQEIRALSLLVHPTIRLAIITAKESDNRVLECAVEGQADVIVTGDRKHLLPLGQYAGVPIVTPRDFLLSLP